MDSPDRMRKTQVCGATVDREACAPDTKTISQEKASTTMVRSAVARLESVLRMPHLAKTAVIPAKNAEPKANRTHITINTSLF